MSWRVTASAIAQAAPAPRPARPFPADGGDVGKPPIEDDAAPAHRRRRRRRRRDDGGERRVRPRRAGRASPSGNRVIAFLRASWAELQRVQWPDRQQVAQATGVVLGFVVLTGVFLGVADYVAGKIINAII